MQPQIAEITQARIFVANSSPQKSRTSPWDDPKINQRLIELLNSGVHSATQMSMILRAEFPACHKISRGSILGKAHRLNISIRPGVRGPSPRRAHSPSEDCHQNAQSPSISRPRRKRNARPVRPIALTVQALAAQNDSQERVNTQSAPRQHLSNASNLRQQDIQHKTITKKEHLLFNSLLREYHTAYLADPSAKPSEEILALATQLSVSPEHLSPSRGASRPLKACCYPTIENNGQHHFCSAPSEPGSSYCTSHRFICYV